MGVDALRPKNDSSPPFGFFLFPSFAGDNSSLSLSFSKTRQPGGRTSSWTTSGLDLTEASHAVDPFVAIYSARGLIRVIGACRVSLKVSPTCFEVKVLENGGLDGKIKSLGISLSTTAVLVRTWMQNPEYSWSREILIYSQALDAVNSATLVICQVWLSVIRFGQGRIRPQVG